MEFDFSNGGLRITPAYAGQICAAVQFPDKVQDHPRIRGTNIILIIGVIENKGSPPHTRDKLKKIKIEYMKDGITPAYAGQIFSSCSLSVCEWDHPRIRGTN